MWVDESKLNTQWSLHQHKFLAREDGEVQTEQRSSFSSVKSV